jgi:type II secretory pathway pseudopilin PulG
MKGMTLVEILVTFGILGLILAGVYQILNIGMVSWQEDRVMQQIQQDVRGSLENMNRELRMADGADVTVASAAGANRVDVSSVPGITGAVSYYLSGGQLVREDATGNVLTLCGDIQSLTFCCVGGADCSNCASANFVEVAITASDTARNRALSFSLTEKVRFRNE